MLPKAGNIGNGTTNDMEIISLTTKNFQRVVEIAARAIQRGNIIAAPTDTVYGLLANAANENAVKKIYAAKNRPAEKPMPIFVKNMAMAKKLALILPKQQELLETKWPGKFTAVLRRNPNAKIFGVDDKTIALRIPFNRFINSLLETLNLPVTGTSANISGKPSATKIDDVINQFAGAAFCPNLIINAGDLPKSGASTIVDLTGNEQKIIRR